MPQCPACKAPYEVGQRYCGLCDSYLLHPEAGDYFCPQCGIRVAPNQEICHKCNARLPGATAFTQAPETQAPSASKPPPVVPPTPSPLPKPGLPLWALGALLGAGFLIIVLLGLLLRQGLAPPDAAQKAPPGTVAAPMVPAAPAASTVPAAEPPPLPAAPAPAAKATLADQVRETLTTLREAQLKNDIVLFMSCYSYLYPSLDKKREQTLAYWKDFKFLDLNYVLDEVKPMGPENAWARVTWSMQIQNRQSQEFDSFTQIYRVLLVKELGKWRVRSIKDISQGDSEE